MADECMDVALTRRTVFGAIAAGAVALSVGPAGATTGAATLPPIAEGFSLPFYYNSLHACFVFHLVEEERVAPFLAGTTLAPALFDGRALVCYDFQLYTGVFPDDVSVVREVELCIVAYPAADRGRVPAVSVRDFLMGDEQTKRMGYHRVWVPCDNDIAIKAGVELFGEPKFKTTFTTSIPTPNVPAPLAWRFACNDPEGAGTIFSLAAHLDGLTPVLAAPSPLTEYGTNGGRPVACRWTILHPLETWMLDATQADRVRLEFGASAHRMRTDMAALIGNAPAVAVQTTASPPSAYQTRAYFY